MKILRLKPGGRGFEIRANNLFNSKSWDGWFMYYKKIPANSELFLVIEQRKNDMDFVFAGKAIVNDISKVSGLKTWKYRFVGDGQLLAVKGKIEE